MFSIAICTAHRRSPPARAACAFRTLPDAVISTPRVVRQCPRSVMATPMCWRPCMRRSTAWPMRTPAFSRPRWPSGWLTNWFAPPLRAWAMSTWSVAAPRRGGRRWRKSGRILSRTEVAERMADDLVRPAPGGMGHVYLVSGGSEAVEAALKMARQYFVEIGQPQRMHFIARRQSYHGNTLGALAVGGNAWRRAPFAPMLVPATHVAPCYPYREQRAGETPEQYGLRLADELDAAIVAQGADRVIAFVAETVGGATAGVLTPVPGYFNAVRAVCDRHGVLLILDEVMCGMGRTGTLYASEQEDVVPDLVTIAKGLGGGYQPVGAVLAQKKIVDALSQGSGFFQHGHTYLGHPVACAAALAVQTVIRRNGLLAKVRADGLAFGAMLRQALGEHPHVGDIRGRGFFWGIELVADRGSKRPFAAALKVHAAVKQDALARGLLCYPSGGPADGGSRWPFAEGVKVHAAVKQDALARGLLCYPSGGTADGVHGDHVLLAPPFIASRADLQEITRLLGASITAVTRASVAAGG